MPAWLGALTLLAHGLVHVAIWVPPTSKDAPLDVHHSAAFGDVRGAAAFLALAAAAAFTASGVGYFADLDWWAPAAVVGAVVSAALMVVTFTRWWLFGLALNAVIAVIAWRATRA